jgi:hypothetical protein
MLIKELLKESSEQELKAALKTVIEFLRNRDHDKKLIPPHSTMGFINMVNNIASGANLTYELLDQIKGSDQTLGNLIDSMDRNSIKFKPFGDEPGVPEQPADDTSSGNSKDPTKVVDAMAKRAAANRS